MISIPKPTKVKSRKITRSAQGRHCTLRVAGQCASRETTVFCHAPSSGKGMRTKSDDFWGAFGCANCHALADENKIEMVDWLRAIYETQKILFTEQLMKVA